MNPVVSNVPEQEETPLIHGPDEFGGRPSPLPVAPLSRKKRKAAIAIVVVLGLLVGGGVLYAWYQYQPSAVLSDALQEFQGKDYYGYEMSITASGGGGNRITRLEGNMEGEVDMIAKRMAGTLFVRLDGGSKSLALEAELRALNEGKTLYFRLVDIPPSLQEVAVLMGNGWLKLEADPEQLAGQVAALTGAPGAQAMNGVMPAPTDESVERLRQRLTAILYDPANYHIVSDKPWWQAIGEREPMHYSVTMKKDAAWSYINAVADGSPPYMGQMLTTEIRESFVEVISAAIVEVWIDGSTHVLTRMRAAIKQREGQGSQPVVIDMRIRSIAAVPVVIEPPESKDVLQVLMQGIMQGTEAMGVGSQDSDADGLSDYDEAVLYHSDPSLMDTDGDGYNDGEEVGNKYNPNGSGLLPPPVPANPAPGGETGYVPAQLNQVIPPSLAQ